MRNLVIGRRFERLTIIQALGKRAPGPRNWWRCQCDCGNFTEIPSNQFGRTRSCGCLSREVTSARSKSHGQSHANNKAYKVWVQMRRRCREKEGYADRGIKVCARWQDFENFLADMGQPSPGMTIERENNDGDYEPGNCVWADGVAQSNNRRSSVFVTANGITKTAAQWARELKIEGQTVRWRLKQGWSPEKALGLS